MQLLNTLNNPEWLQYLASGIVGALVYTSLIPDGRNELRWFLVVYIVPFAVACSTFTGIVATLSASALWWPAFLNYWIAAILSSALLPILFVFLKNNDLPHKLLRKQFQQKWSITREHQFPTSLANVFNNKGVTKETWITLVLKQSGCHVTGNSYEYPGSDAEQFVLNNVRWDCDCCADKAADVIIIGMSEIAAVMLTNPKSEEA